ncbi:MAG: gamma-D-glutamyl-L-lysine dipeptidyl-peptidase [Gaiellales bacterium]|nr:gamma-D-glutamyl-L-lysine dipeptidyl-peptidase [Gaiellales bacterium]MDX6549573.1 gamma-D-glutamyl-L-lysine dipeptidyl-peptidase [Gaiellales bacterium]
MHRNVFLRLPRAIGVMLLLAVLAGFAHAGPASADTLLAQKQAQYQKVQRAVRKLDNRVEFLSERYDATVLQLHKLRGQIVDANHRLDAAQAHLLFEENVLSELMVARYKGLDAGTLDIVLGATSLDEVTGQLDIQRRFDDAVSSAVLEIRGTRDEIARQRQVLILARAQRRHQKLALEKRRREIAHMLVKRRKLMALVGDQVLVAQAAESIGQTKLALDAQTWVLTDQKRRRNDPGAVLRDQIVLDGLAQIGVPYKWGGASPEGGFDCSGLVMWLWAQHGVALPHFAASQYRMGPWVSESDLQIGDLVFFHKLGHVGIYIGNGYVLHAPHTGVTVRIELFSTPWFQSTYVGATRPGPA